MGSTNKTTNLDLSLWTETDKPQRMDFIYDNNRIDSLLGGHIKDAAIHMSAEEKEKLNNRVRISTRPGTGHDSLTIPLSFTPVAVLYMCIDMPLHLVNPNGLNIIYGGAATQMGATQGLSLSGNSLTISSANIELVPQTAGATCYQMDVRGLHYVIIEFG